MPAFVQHIPLWTLIALFAASAVAVWLARSRLAGLADAISERTGLGQAFTGILLLGGVTSLPGVAAVSTSAAYGNAPLAINTCSHSIDQRAAGRAYASNARFSFTRNGSRFASAATPPLTAPHRRIGEKVRYAGTSARPLRSLVLAPG